jgi:hypothetical protein
VAAFKPKALSSKPIPASHEINYKQQTSKKRKYQKYLTVVI